MKVHVNTLWDFSVGISVHGYWQIPPTPPPPGPELSCPKLPAIEIPIPHGWPVGVGMGTVKKTTTVLHKGAPVILDGHDCGLLIPQLTVNPANVWIPVMPFTSKRKTMFSAFTVRMDGTPTAVASPIFFPMMSCGSPVSVPLTLPFTNLGNTVKVGVTLADIVGGFLTIAFTIGLDLLFNKVAWFKKIDVAEGAAAETIKQAARKNLQKALAKAALSTLTGFTTSAIQHAIDSRYPMKVKFALSLDTKPPVTLNINGQFGSSDPTNNPSSLKVGVEVELGKLERPMGPRGSDGKPIGDNVGIGSLKASGELSWTFDAGSKQGAEGVSVSRGVNGEIIGASGEFKRTDTVHTNPAPGGALFTHSTEGSATIPYVEAKGSVTTTVSPGAPNGPVHTSVEGSVTNSLPGHSGQVRGEHVSPTPWGLLL